MAQLPELHVYIPFRDKVDLTVACLRSVFRQQMGGTRLSVYLIDNGSKVSTINTLLDFLANETPPKVSVLQHRSDQPFNFSQLCNLALISPSNPAPGACFLFLNNDIVLEDENSFFKMLSFMKVYTDIGALGITLLYPNRKVQHLFAAPGVKIVAAHPYKGLDKSCLKEWNKNARQVPAVTGACIMVKAASFLHIGGFDEKLPTVGQDIDLCLKLQESGFSNWVLPSVAALHFESASRYGVSIARREVEYVHKKWGTKLTRNKHYPAIISRWSEQPSRRLFDRDYPYKLALSRTEFW